MIGGNKITQSRLKEMLQYDPKSGLFKWKKQNSSRGIVGEIAGSEYGNGYLRIGVDGKYYSVHRLAWLYMAGYFPENQIDHKDRDKGNNRWNNLREVSQSCNMKNTGMFKNNKSGVKGVCWHKKRKKWRSIITVENKTINLGRFKNLTDAVIARFNAEIKHGFNECCEDSSAAKYLKNINRSKLNVGK